jgi:hypothetical protein
MASDLAAYNPAVERNPALRTLISSIKNLATQQRFLSEEESQRVVTETLSLLGSMEDNHHSNSDIGITGKVRVSPILEITAFTSGSNCNLSNSAFSTREEINKTNLALAQIMKFVLRNNEAVRADFERFADISLKGKNLDSFTKTEREELARFFFRNSSDPRILQSVAHGFAEGEGNFSSETRRQLMCAMEAMSLHQKHEHVISQFDCDKTSYLATLALFEIAKNLPEHHQTIPHFRNYYNRAYGSDAEIIYDRLFSPKAIAKTKQAIVELSPLAEEEKSIGEIATFTEAMLSDPDILAYVTKSGVVKQTRSNSDGSAAIGAHEIVIRHLEANKAVRHSVAARPGLELDILQGIGANDIERMAPWDIELLYPKFTCQGSDAQHQTPTRMIQMLLASGKDQSEQQLDAFIATHGAENLEQVLGALSRRSQ